MNPLGIMKQLLFIGLLVGAVYIIYRIWTNKSGGTDKRSFAMAAKQSKRRVKQRQAAGKHSGPSKQRPLRRKSAAHLTVIEGYKDKPKSKKKDRAIF